MTFNTIPEIVEDLAKGRMVILMDDEDRENEGDLIMVAEKVRAEDVNFMARYACGLICLTLTAERCQQLRLPLMVHQNQAQHNTNFTVSIEAAEGVTTGISAADRACTIQKAVAGDASPEDIVQPGHIFPLMAKPGGVLSRAGHTEAGCDLARLAGFEPAAAIVEIMNADGSMARRGDLEQFAQTHNLKIGTIADLIHYRTLHEKTVSRVEERLIETRYGDFDMVMYRDNIQGSVHVALVKGDIKPEEPTLVRVSQLEMFRDFLGAESVARPSWSLSAALEAIAEQGRGVVVMLAADDPAEDLISHASQLSQEAANDTVRSAGAASNAYSTVGTGSQILRDLNIRKMRLLSPAVKYAGLSGFDLEVVEYLEPGINP